VEITAEADDRRRSRIDGEALGQGRQERLRLAGRSKRTMGDRIS